MRRLRGFLIGLTLIVSACGGGGPSGLGQPSITAGSPVVTPEQTPPAGVYGTPYRFQFTATGGLLPLTWKVTLGAVPPGLTLGADGSLTGAPTTRTGSPVFPAIGAIGLLLLTACGRGGGRC
jgi:hypothetical protein